MRPKGSSYRNLLDHLDGYLLFSDKKFLGLLGKGPRFWLDVDTFYRKCRDVQINSCSKDSYPPGVRFGPATKAEGLLKRGRLFSALGNGEGRDFECVLDLKAAGNFRRTSLFAPQCFSLTDETAR